MRLSRVWRRLCVGIVSFTAMLGLDQFTKYLAVVYLADRDIILIPGVFRLVYVENYGSAFGTWQNSLPFLVTVTLLLMLCVVCVYRKLLFREGYGILRGIALGILAGGTGNLIDRLSRGCVVDFLYFEIIKFPVFNIADCFITCSIALLLICIFTVYKDDNMDFLYPF